MEELSGLSRDRKAREKPILTFPTFQAIRFLRWRQHWSNPVKSQIWVVSGIWKMQVTELDLITAEQGKGEE